MRSMRPGLYDQDDPAAPGLEPLRLPASTGRYGPVVGAQLLRKAESFAEAAKAALDEDHEVAALLAALAGMAAADAICSLRLDRRSSPIGHRDAPRLLAQAAPGATEAVTMLEALARVREAARPPTLTRMEARRAVAHAVSLVDYAEQTAFGDSR